MKTVPEVRPERTAAPSSPFSSKSAPPWHPADPGRWAALNLSDPSPSGRRPEGATIADFLIWALIAEGAEDPIEGIIEGVRGELLGLADLLGTTETSCLLAQLAARLGVACTLLAFTDERMPMPLDPSDDEETPPGPTEASAAPAAAPADINEPSGADEATS